MLKQLLLVGAVILYAGCSSKNEDAMEKSFEKVIDRGTQMQKTEKIKIIQNDEVKVFLLASYLNGEESAAEEDDTINEKFVVGLYLIDDGNMTREGLINADQNLTINIPYPESDKKFTDEEKMKRKQGMDKLPTTVKKLSSGDPLLKNIPMINSWSTYYYVEFPPTPKKQFSLTYQNRIYGKKPMPMLPAVPKTKQHKKHTEKAGSQTDSSLTPQYYQYRLNFTKQPKYLYGSHKKLF